MLDKMQAYLDQFEDTDKTELPAVWPEEILPQTTELFVSDFPLGKPGVTLNEYQLNPSLPFAQIENAKDDFVFASTLYKQTKAFRWLKAQIIENQSGRDLGFGQISRLLHDALADDPAPYRQEIKDLQANLYSYLKFYASDEIEIYMPGRRSEILRVL